MESPPSKVGLGLLVAAILFIVSLAFILGYLVILLLDLPVRLGLPLPFFILGIAVLAATALLLAWLFKFRRIGDIAISTYVTVRKAIKGIPFEVPSGRVEPLVVVGPYKYVRHPLYLNVILLAIGWWLVLDYTFIILGGVFLFLWFYFFLEELEEKELRLLYGEAYENYAREVPKMVPFTRLRRK
jgi:protein-S-isoprenylcysteine O-methyltransferase Ste14